MEHVVGIDLGTTFSAIAIVDENQRPRIIPNKDNKNITPSVIYFQDNSNYLVGDDAKEMQAFGEDNIAAFFKRAMGDPKHLRSFYDRDYSPIDLSAIILKSLKDDAEANLYTSINKAVITVPAYFNNIERNATIEAGKNAGLDVLRIVNEPTAAAISFGINKKPGTNYYLIYDLGGGTFDVSIVKIEGNQIDVIATDGDSNLGGKDWDDRIYTFVSEQFEEDYNIDISNDFSTYNDVIIRCENAKRNLSAKEKTTIKIACEGETGKYELTRSQFETITKDKMELTQSLTEIVVKDAGLNWSQLEGVLTVGGSTRMPMVHEYIKKMSGKPPLPGIEPDDAVALGASILAFLEVHKNTNDSKYSLGGCKIRKIIDVTPHSLGMVAKNKDESKYINSIIIPKNKPTPCKESKYYEINTSPNYNNELTVLMLQGENVSPMDCTLLGNYVFYDISHVSTSSARINVEYEYDKNGTVQVKATEESTKNELPMRIEPVPLDLEWLALPPQDENITAPMFIMLSIDVSYSMDGPGLDEAKEAAHAFVDKVLEMDNVKIGLAAFHSQAKIICSLTHKKKVIKNAINELAVGGFTNMTDGILLPYKKIKKCKGSRYIILFTDGGPDDSKTTYSAAQKVCANDIELITIGTKGADHSFLKSLACSDENSFFAQTGQVVNTFSKIAKIIGDSHGSNKITFFSK